MSQQRILYVQSALLYSTSEGQRRIRVHNMAVPLTNIMANIHDYLDVNALTLFFARKALNTLIVNKHNF